MRDRVEEVGRAVERVDDEARLAGFADDLARLFHQEPPARTVAAEFVIEGALGGLVGLRHEVGRALLRDLEMLDLAKVTAQLGAGLARGAFHDGDDAGYGHKIISPLPLAGGVGGGNVSIGELPSLDRPSPSPSRKREGNSINPRGGHIRGRRHARRCGCRW